MPDPSPLGSWAIRSWVVTYDDGTVKAPFGDDPVGFLHYAANGMMFAQFAARDGQGGHISYAGPYRIEGSRVTHRIVVCDRPELIGTDLIRDFSIEGDTLVIRVHRTTFGARSGAAILKWTKVQPTKGTQP